MDKKDISNQAGIKGGYNRSGLAMMTEHDLVNLSLKDFLAIVLDTEGSRRRHALVGKKSPIRGFLRFKLRLLERVGKRFSLADREKLRIEKATLLYKMMKEEEDFFKEFNREVEKITTAADQSKETEPAKKCSNEAIYKLSLEQLVRFSMTTVDITNMLGIPAWIMIALHIFKQHLSKKTPILLDELIASGFSFSSTLVDTVLSENQLLSDRHKSMLASALKREGGIEAIKNAENIFFNMESTRAVFVPQTLNKFRLGDKFVSVLAGIPICKLQLQNSSGGKSIIITAVTGSEYSLTANRISLNCPLKERCQKVAQRFSEKDLSCRLSCKQCPLRDKHKGKDEELSFGISAERNFLAT